MILFELLTAKHPFAGDTALALGMAHLLEPVPPLGPHVPPALAVIVLRLLQKAPEARFRSMRDVVDAFDQCFDPGPVVRAAAPAASPPPVVASSDGPSTRALFTGGLALVVGALAIVAVAIPRNDVPSRAAVPPSSEARADLLKGPHPDHEPDPVAYEQPDLTEDRGDSDLGADLGAGAKGWGKLFGTAYRHYPPGDPEDYQAVVGVLIPGSNASQSEFLGHLRILERADRERLILVVPSSDVGGAGGSWEPSDAMEAWEEIERVASDHDLPVFILAAEYGGDAAHTMACRDRRDRISAIAVTSHRDRVGKQFTCGTEPFPVPYLNVVPMGTPIAPIDGGYRCGDRNDVQLVSIEAHEAYWRQANNCRGPKTTWRSKPHGECITWRCETPFVSCRVEGGVWPDWGRERKHECAGKPAPKFPYQDVIWEFFAEQLPAASN